MRLEAAEAATQRARAAQEEAHLREKRAWGIDRNRSRAHARDEEAWAVACRDLERYSRAHFSAVDHERRLREVVRSLEQELAGAR